MTNSYKELLKQREALEHAIASARQQELSEAIGKARELVAEFGLTVQDVFHLAEVLPNLLENLQVAKLLLNTVTQLRVKLGLAVAKPLNGLMVKTELNF